MLDDLKYIHERDSQDALGLAEKQWQQLEHSFDLPQLSFEIENVVVGGMGGSALAALISQSWPTYQVPFEIVKDYEIPAYVSDKTLFIASSYSGNTEETLEAASKAKNSSANIVVISSGGKLEKFASENNYPFIKLPGGIQPRYAALYGFKAMLTILIQSGLIDEAMTTRPVSDSAELLKESAKTWRADVKTADNEAKKLALELSGSTPVIYSGPRLYPAAYKWKISINENAKNVAWVNQFPEFNHNEFLGWTSHPVDKPYKIVQLKSPLEHERTIKRFEVTNKLLSGRWPNPYIVEAKGSTILEQLLYLIAFGDFVSIYLALLNGLNPSPVDLIEKLKKDLG